PTQIYTLSLHDALPICVQDEVDLLFDRHQARRDAVLRRRTTTALSESKGGGPEVLPRELQLDLLLWLRARRHVPTRVVAKPLELDRKSTRLNSSHVKIS